MDIFTVLTFLRRHTNYIGYAAKTPTNIVSLPISFDAGEVRVGRHHQP